MIRLNRAFLNSALGKHAVSLDNGLKGALDEGISIIDGCFFLKFCMDKTTNARRENFIDDLGYEVFINQISIDIFCRDHLVQQAMAFTHGVINIARAQNLEIIGIISIVDQQTNVNVRFHKRRGNSSWLSPDLDGYEEGILELSSRDHEFLSLFFPTS